MQHQISLKPFNTFGIEAKARYFTRVESISALKEALLDKNCKEKFILGGGSNMLLTSDLDAHVIHLAFKGKDIIWEDESMVHLKVQAGENWHDFVQWTLKQNYGGIENLSLIPGNVGAAPIQNIGAYGVELKDVFIGCEAMDTTTGTIKKFTKKACNFGYRESVFKNTYKGKYVITSVTFCLTKKNHKIHTSYGAIETALAANGITNPTIQDVSKAVISIRESKLPNPAQIGNSGSFFKNPVVSIAVFNDIVKKYPDMPHYHVSEESIKIPAGWLIEQCGFKGKRYGDAGVHDKQALVLVNYGSASGKEILELAKKIQEKVKQVFQIDIETEVNII